jgi:hypothetical protein
MHSDIWNSYRLGDKTVYLMSRTKFSATSAAAAGFSGGKAVQSFSVYIVPYLYITFCLS